MGLLINGHIGYKIRKDLEKHSIYIVNISAEIEKPQFVIDKIIIVGMMYLSPNPNIGKRNDKKY